MERFHDIIDTRVSTGLRLVGGLASGRRGDDAGGARGPCRGRRRSPARRLGRPPPPRERGGRGDVFVAPSFIPPWQKEGPSPSMGVRRPFHGQGGARCDAPENCERKRPETSAEAPPGVGMTPGGSHAGSGRATSGGTPTCRSRRATRAMSRACDGTRVCSSIVTGSSHLVLREFHRTLCSGGAWNACVPVFNAGRAFCT